MQDIDVINWRKWAIDRARNGEMVFRLMLEIHVGQMRVKAMILNTAKLGDRTMLGIITFDNQPGRYVASSSHALECAVVNDGQPGGWDTFLALSTSLEEYWVTESRTVCLFHDMLAHNLEYINPGGFLAMEYIARIYGMIYQAAATSDDTDKQAVFRQAEERLDQLLKTKRRGIASLAAGL